MNTSELKQTLVARACSYELAQAIADEIDRLRAENARVYEEGVSRLIEAQKINNREIESLRADLNAAKTALENQIAHTTEIANLCARQRAWIDGVMAQGACYAIQRGIEWMSGNALRTAEVGAQTSTRTIPLITRPAPFEDK